jgi:hypothetical protein
MSIINNPPEEAVPSKRWGRIPEAVSHSGWSKSSLYKRANEHPGLFRKYGRATFVDLHLLDKIIDEAPPATLATSS